MKAARVAVVAMWTLAGLAAGCSPSVSVRHVLPGALPLPPDVMLLRAGRFAVRTKAEGAAADYASFLKAALDKRLAGVALDGSGAGGAAETPAAKVALVGGEVDVAVRNAAGERVGRRWNPATKKNEPQTLPTLVRTAEVRVTFTVARQGGQRLGAAEILRMYSSAADPAVRGELGLERADDPARVPSVDSIVQGLLTECAETFAHMAQPLVLSAEMQLRPAGGDSARAGMSAAAKEDYAAAVGHFRKAVEAARDNGDVRFDLAAVAEAAGQLELAAEQYQAAVDNAKAKEGDAEAKESLARVRRVIAAAKAVGGYCSVNIELSDSLSCCGWHNSLSCDG